MLLQPLVYMSLHIFLTMATFAVAKIWWSFYGAHTFFLLACLAVSAWNGASYYFDVFAHRYVAGLEALLQVRDGLKWKSVFQMLSATADPT